MKKDKLHNLKDNGFKVPEGYFNGLEDQIISELKLKDITKEPGFKIPGTYFDTLEDTIVSKTKHKETKVVKLFSKKVVLYASSIAAAILLLFNLSIFEKENIEPDYASLENYLLNEDISAYEIASFLEEEDLTEENFVEFNIDKDAVEDYIFENLDVEDLY
ncbi:hypothetical protein [Seonamhaeicola sp. ML3]|uniref:hypothetical protein n=1 Tax=Seonamhaeicola sp. ML3 TaxID=2937786 RepID=UPI00200D92FC|nr:hypothetical protein [Seonamhaeicola sp. ML3]